MFFEYEELDLGPNIANTFISDDDPTFYSIYSHVMTIDYKLLCMWHVHRNWLKNTTKIRNAEKKKIVFKTFCALIRMTNDSKFVVALTEVLQDLKGNFKI